MAFSDPEKSARSAATPGRHEPTGGNPVDPAPTLQRIEQTPDVDAVTRTRLELGTSPLELAAERIEDARPELREALKMLDCTEHRDLHLRLGNLVNDLVDFRSLLAERYGS
jgi:hypothetical protein